MPCMSTSAYQKQVDSILEVVEDYIKEELTQAGQRLRNIGVSGSRMSQQEQKLTKMMTVCLRYF